MTTIVSFNVNGIRSVNAKDKAGAKGCVDATQAVLARLAAEQAADILCLQEIKTQSAADLEQYRSIFPHIYARWPTEKKGYSGVAILSRAAPITVTEPMIGSIADAEGRIICAEYVDFVVVNCYTPNSKDGLARLEERLEWDALFSTYLQGLVAATNKPLVVVGDLNCAHQEIDVHNPKNKGKSAGFSREERDSFTCLLHETGLVDTYRVLHPTEVKYSWWSAISRGRERGVGWRIDYVLASPALMPRIVGAEILGDYYGSDHCPVSVRIGPQGT
jgi:exodeoxyribonuclease-3